LIQEQAVETMLGRALERDDKAVKHCGQFAVIARLARSVTVSVAVAVSISVLVIVAVKVKVSPGLMQSAKSSSVMELLNIHCDGRNDSRRASSGLKGSLCNRRL
jgi:hypothetical protein